MRKHEFKRRLRQLVEEELARTDLKALVREAITRIDFSALVSECRAEMYGQTEQRRTPLVLH